MKNWEKYAEDISKTAVGYFALTKSGEITSCTSVSCGYCQFRGDGDCGSTALNWLYSEYEPPEPKLTAQDKAFLDCIEMNGYIARDKIGSLFCYLCKPTKDLEVEGEWNDADCFALNKHLFKFISWEDEKPWLISELKNLEVE